MFTFFKLIDVLNLLCSKFACDYEVQLVLLQETTKMKRKVFSFLLLSLSLFFQLLCFWGYTVAIGAVLEDSSELIYFLFIKINFLQIKKVNKTVSLKSLHRMLNQGFFIKRHI